MISVEELMKCVNSGEPMPCACGLSADNGVSIADINRIGACSNLASALIKCTYCQPEKPNEISASELIAKYPSLSLAAIGIMLFTNVMYGKLDAEEKLIKILRTTSIKMRYGVVKSNKAFFDKIKNTGNIGIDPSGKIGPLSIKEPWWKILVEALAFIGVIVCVVVAIIFPETIPAMLGIASLLAMISVIVSTVVSILMNSGISGLNKRALQIAADVAPMINLMYDVASFWVDLTYVHPWGGDVSEERFRNGEMAKAVLSTILTTAVTMGYFNTAGAGGIPVALQRAMAATQGTLAVISGVFEIAKGAKGLKIADEVFDMDRLKAVIEAEKEAIQNLSDLINTVIQGLNTDTNILAMEFAKISDVIKLEGDTRAMIARNITI
ncbi:MAG: hypothetical protein LBF94_02430 [Puniceicoccales bacterium]|jgi:hypothetical protein|nr:hypothetical protein [Puniceicoccales bacterium]